jgi:MinD-like ATPase involved in chromosome partitioning or flagellar assembly
MIRLYLPVLQGGYSRAPIVSSDPESSAAKALVSIAEQVISYFGAPAAR